MDNRIDKQTDHQVDNQVDKQMNNDKEVHSTSTSSITCGLKRLLRFKIRLSTVLLIEKFNHFLAACHFQQAVSF